MREERDRLAGELSAVIRTADRYREELQHVPGVTPLRDIAQAIREDSDEMLEDGRLLRLGIVGQIKAGKSTLLNLLLFGGDEVLPKAATPMTASLTHIVHSDAVGADHAQIDIEYYTPEEWREIENHASEFRKEEDAGRSPGELLRACAELVAMARQRRLRVTDHAGTETESISMDRLGDRLCSLVGVDGELTPLVRNVTIRYGGGIPDLDVVDTPGLNDPIISRDRATRRLLGKCDAVLLLSYAGQFMDSSDHNLFTHTLPADGISKRVLIGSKFDSALIDVAPDYRGDLPEAADDVERRLLDRIERMRDEAADLRLAPEHVLFTSGLCATLGGKPYAQWSAAERGVFAALRKWYPDWLAPPKNGEINDDTRSILTNELGRKEKVDEEIQTIRAKKDRYMEEKLRDYLQEKEAACRSCVDTAIADLKEKQEELRSSSDLAKIEDKKKAAVRTIDKMSSQISEEWKRLIANQMKGLDTAQKCCQEAIGKGRRAIPDSIEVKQKSRIIGKKKRGFLGLAWLIRSIRDIPHEDYETYEQKVMNESRLRANLEEARDNVRMHVDQELGKMFSFDFAADAGKKLRTVCAGEMDNTTASEAQPSFGRALGSAVEHISEQARRALSRNSAKLGVLSVDLSGDMQQKESVAFAYANVLSNEARSIFKAAEAIAGDANKKANEELLSVARRDLEKYHERLQQEIKDKVFTLQRYDKAIRDLEQHGRRFARADSAQDRKPMAKTAGRTHILHLREGGKISER